MNWPSARSSRASWPFSTTNRAPLMREAASKSIRPSAPPRSTWSLGEAMWFGSPQRRSSTLSSSSSPTGTSAMGRLGRAASRSKSSALAAFSASAWAAPAPFRLSTSASRRWASASFFWALAWPISLESSLRLAWAVSAAVLAARTLPSSSIAWAAAPERPFAAQAFS